MRDILTIYWDGEHFKQIIYFYKLTYPCIMRDISTDTRVSIFSADRRGVSDAQADVPQRRRGININVWISKRFLH
jgi:hypothetical protein